jgi:hypothetical protein
MSFKNIKTATDLVNEAQLASDNLVIAQAEQYLSDTDWIVVKVSELVIDGIDTTDIKQQYATELDKRKVSRDTINSLQPTV